METRVAIGKDSEHIASLMEQLGYEADTALVKAKLLNFQATDIDEVFVVEDTGKIIGLVSCHVTSLFHQKGSSGRITSMIVDQNYRGRGVGSGLIRTAEQYFRARDCVKIEVSSGTDREDAHRFYQSCGYGIDGIRFIGKIR